MQPLLRHRRRAALAQDWLNPTQRCLCPTPSGRGPFPILAPGHSVLLSSWRCIFRDVMRSAELWLLALFLSVKYGSQVAFPGLWGVPYIASVYGVSPAKAAGAGQANQW